MAKEFNLTPRRVNAVQTKYRKIATAFPVPETVPMLESLARIEPVAMRGQPPVVWDHAEGFQVWDAYGNCWVDWSSGVLITNAGHSRPEVRDAIKRQADQKLLTTYCFPNAARAHLLEKLSGALPKSLEKIFLLTTGSEAVECAIKLCRSWGVRQGGRSKHVIVSFTNAFHGRTLGSQQVGGTPGLKEWIVNLDPGFVQIPFPDGIWGEQISFDNFERQLFERGIEPQNVAGVIIETYQGGTAAFAPRAYMQALSQWCTGHKALLVCDEVQAGFGRTGKMWGFEHYGIVPDLTTFGKGISSSLPLSAVAGRADAMDQFPPGGMTSTHTGNPVCCAAGLASLEVILKENLVENARVQGDYMHSRLNAIRERTPEFGFLAGKGLVAGLIAVQPGTRTPDGEFAWDVVRRSVEKGVLMFSPVGYKGSTVKIAPPLVITREALDDSLTGFEEAVAEAVAARKPAAQ
jgi:4-aminobutyrate aminotransferase-like enzyme